MTRTEVTIQPDELTAQLGDPDLRILDARPLAAYNGWRLRGESRGGHVPGAGALPAEWLPRLDDDDLRALAAGHGLGAGTRTVLYGHDDADVEALAERLAGATASPGSSRLAAGFADWAADERLPTGAPAQLSPSWSTPNGSRELLAGGRPEAAPAGHVPALPRQLRRARGVRRGPPPRRALPGHELAGEPGRLEPPRARGPDAARSAALGITHDTTVVLYGRDTEGEANEKWPGRRAGQIAATRAAADPALRRGRRRPTPRRRLRLVGPSGLPARDDRRASRSRSPAFGVADPAAARTSSSTSPRPKRSSPTGTAPRW